VRRAPEPAQASPDYVHSNLRIGMIKPILAVFRDLNARPVVFTPGRRTGPPAPFPALPETAADNGE